MEAQGTQGQGHGRLTAKEVTYETHAVSCSGGRTTKACVPEHLGFKEGEIWGDLADRQTSMGEILGRPERMRGAPLPVGGAHLASAGFL